MTFACTCVVRVETLRGHGRCGKKTPQIATCGTVLEFTVHSYPIRITSICDIGIRFFLTLPYPAIPREENSQKACLINFVYDHVSEVWAALTADSPNASRSGCEDQHSFWVSKPSFSRMK